MGPVGRVSPTSSARHDSRPAELALPARPGPASSPLPLESERARGTAGPAASVCKASTVATAKAERLLNLVIALVNSPRFRSAAWIREKVAGYLDAPTEEAFFRTFERDKTELRDLGIPLQTAPDGADGYRIPPGEFALPELTFTPAETAALGLAARLWETTALAGAGATALRKIRDAGGVAGSTDEDLSQAVAAANLLQPRVRTGDPAFAPLFAAVRSGRAVAFDYRKRAGEAAEPRSVQPYGLVSFKGRWYLVGFDADRSARRTFRLSRIGGDVKATGRAGAVRTPDGLDLLAEVADSVEPSALATADLLVRPGRGAGLRRSATVAGTSTAGPRAGWDQLHLPYAHLWDVARTIAGLGSDVVVLGPADLRNAVIRLLTGAQSEPTDHLPERLPEDALPALIEGGYRR